MTDVSLIFIQCCIYRPGHRWDAPLYQHLFNVKIFAERLRLTAWRGREGRAVIYTKQVTVQVFFFFLLKRKKNATGAPVVFALCRHS